MFPAFDVVHFQRFPCGSSCTDSNPNGRNTCLTESPKNFPSQQNDREVRSAQEYQPVDLHGGTRWRLVIWHRFSSGSSSTCASGLLFIIANGTSFSFSFASVTTTVLEVLSTASIGLYSLALRRVGRSAQSFTDLLFVKFTAVLGLVRCRQ